MIKHPQRIYVDTSVVGGCLDDEFADASTRLIAMAKRGEVVLLISALLAQELEEAPAEVKAVLDTVPFAALELVNETAESRQLRDAYLAATVVGRHRPTMPIMSRWRRWRERT